MRQSLSFARSESCVYFSFSSARLAPRPVQEYSAPFKSDRAQDPTSQSRPSSRLPLNHDSKTSTPQQTNQVALALGVSPFPLPWRGWWHVLRLLKGTFPPRRRHYTEVGKGWHYAEGRRVRR